MKAKGAAGAHLRAHLRVEGGRGHAPRLSRWSREAGGPEWLAPSISAETSWAGAALLDGSFPPGLTRAGPSRDPMWGPAPEAASTPP